mmetsp:Transcript_16661/g.36123  ORF Transcript_16661/g.36123 Transcript_16661/m.36123 type:complete len:85 (-) Transcript_16661:27-281(-)
METLRRPLCPGRWKWEWMDDDNEFDAEVSMAMMDSLAGDTLLTEATAQPVPLTVATPPFPEVTAPPSPVPRSHWSHSPSLTPTS